MTDQRECALLECHEILPPERKKFCSELHGRRHRTRQAPDAVVAPEVQEKEELRAALRRSQTATAKAKAKTDDLIAAVYRAARDAALAQGHPSEVKRQVFSSGKGKPEVALVHATDWQYGKETESYNMAICESRVDLLGDKIDLLTNIQRAEHPVNHAVLAFGGDMLEGLNIFPGQAHEVEAPLYEQLFGVAKLEEHLIRRMLATFETVTVVAEPGNHGRLGRRGDWPATDNTDRMAYEITRQRFADNKRVIWTPYLSWYQMIVIQNYRAILIHGDEIKSFGGNTPAYGILRKVTSWSSGVTEPFQDAYVGHYHTPLELTLPNGGTIFGTGSTESDNAYAAEFVAAKGKPSQRLHYIDPVRGRVTCRYQVYLGELSDA
jgi:hypothetical protein